MCCQEGALTAVARPLSAAFGRHALWDGATASCAITRPCCCSTLPPEPWPTWSTTPGLCCPSIASPCPCLCHLQSPWQGFAVHVPSRHTQHLLQGNQRRGPALTFQAVPQASLGRFSHKAHHPNRRFKGFPTVPLPSPSDQGNLASRRAPAVEGGCHRGLALVAA